MGWERWEGWDGMGRSVGWLVGWWLVVVDFGGEEIGGEEIGEEEIRTVL